MNLDARNIQIELTDALERHRVAGASIAVFHEGTLATAAAGFANISTGVGLTTDTIMHIGSITKVFNATLVMQLVDQGLVDLADPVRKYLPDFRVKDATATEEITVMMLINHTSGIDGETPIDNGHDEETIEKAVRRMSAYSQVFSPGAYCSYSNAATVVAGHLAEKVTNRNWYDLVKTRIFEPLGLPHSAVLPEDAMLFRTSVGHFIDRTTGALTRTSHVFLPLGFAPAGHTAMMSAADLVMFARAHLCDGLSLSNKRILSPLSAQLMRGTTTPNIGQMPYGIGLGWMTYGADVVGHGGGGPGIKAQLYASPAQQFALAVLTNSDNGTDLIIDIAAPYLRQICGFEIAQPVELAKPSTESTEESFYAGRYEDSWIVYDVSKNESGLTLSVRTKIACYDNMSTEPTDAAPLIRAGEDQFIFTPTARQSNANPCFFPATRDIRVAFRNKDSSGRPEHLASGARLYRRTA
ncbi:beta-lactamase family protein [Mesorhizobium sp. M0119]|uniref:serine hydrolase domain-containing protein n=1 Tax=Mesorhizobium sp. M0119 TaxID=2956885 RepID=UPI003335E178